MMQILIDLCNTSITEVISCVGMEFMMFVVATAMYLLYVGDGKTAMSLLKKDKASCGKNFESPKLARATTNAPARKIKGQSSARDDASALVPIIRGCARAKDIKGARAAFDKLHASGTALNAQVHNCLIEAYLQCDDFHGALKHFRDIANDGTADVVTYNIVLKAFLSLGKMDEAKKLLAEMAQRGLPASRVTFHQMLNAEVNVGNQRAAWKVVDEMTAAGHIPDAVTCAILAKCLKDGAHPWNVERVMSLVAELPGPVDEVLLSSMVEACVRIRRMEVLSKLLSQCEGKENGLNLSAPSYGSLIKAYAQVGDVARMWALWRQMTQRDVKPTAVTLGCMIDALVTNNKVKDAWELVNQVYAQEETRDLVNTIIYSTVLKGFAKEQDIKTVFLIFAEMTERDISCNVITFNTMIDACARCGCMDRVPQLLESMRKESVEPDLVTYSSLVKGYSLAGDVRRGFKVFEEMKSSGKVLPDEIMYNVLLDGCAREGLVEEALKLLESMQGAGIAPSNHTLSILVKLLGRAKRVKEAFKVVDDLTAKHGLRPNIQVYTCLMQACLNNRQLDKAMAAHDKMVADAHCKPDERAYTALVRGCLQANGLDEAVHALRSAFHLKEGQTQPRHSAPGVDAELLAEAVSRLRVGQPKQQAAASQLVADLKEKRGIDVETIQRPSRSSGRNGNSGRGARGGANIRQHRV
jgi:pentatricopeptide repeat protein